VQDGIQGFAGLRQSQAVEVPRRRCRGLVPQNGLEHDQRLPFPGKDRCWEMPDCMAAERV